jgi:hypothetical protein
MERIEGMPRYRCHKEVEAAKIAEVRPQPNGIDYALILNDEKILVIVNELFVEENRPEPGKYFVQYADGYQSVSPEKAFEEGYTRIPDAIDPALFNPDQTKLWVNLCPRIRSSETADRVFNVLCEDGMAAAMKLVGELNDEYRLKGAVTA